MRARAWLQVYKGLKSYQLSKFNVSVFLSKAHFSFALVTVTFELLELEQSCILHLKALMCGIMMRAKAWLQVYNVPGLSENDTFTT